MKQSKSGKSVAAIQPVRLPSWSIAALAASLLLASAANSAPATADATDAETQSTSQAAAILARFKAVTGGDAWDSVRSEHIVSIVNWDNHAIQSDLWLDSVGGYFHVSAQTVPPIGPNYSVTGASAIGLTAAQWRWLGGPLTTISASYPSTLLRGYLNPDQRTGQISAVASPGNGQDIVVLTQESSGIGNHAIRLTFDHASGLLAQVTGTLGDPDQSIEFSDWQRCQGILEPFVAVDSIGGSSPALVVSQVASADVNVPVPFSVYGGSKQVGQDYAFAPGVTSTTVPLRVADKHFFVPIKIDGHSYQAFLDTGAQFCMSDSLAETLGLQPTGKMRLFGLAAAGVAGSTVKVETVQIGGLTLNQVPFGTIAVPQYFSANPFIGSELLERFVVSIDQDAKTLTLTEPAHFSPPAGAVAIPLRYRGAVPEVPGSVDGLPGLFTLDTGDDASLSFNTPFVAENNLIAKYKPAFTTTTGYGLGGPVRSSVVRIKTLTLGSAIVHDRIADLSTSTTGSLSWQGPVGNVGTGVLRQFNMIFDYPHDRVFLTPDKAYGEPDYFERVGFTLDASKDGFVVGDVIPGSPASEAGLKPGDVLLKVNGRSLDDKSIDLGAADGNDGIAPVGNEVRFEILPGGHRPARTITLALKDLI